VTRPNPLGSARWSQADEPYGAFPKVTLHDHLDGSLRPETLIELAADQDVTLPYEDPEKLASWFTGEITEPKINHWEDMFGLTTRVMQTEENIARVAREWVREAAADGVIYGETRWAPEKHTAGGLPLIVAVEAVALGLQQGEADVAAAGGHIRARQLICGMRTSTLSLEIARLTVAAYGRWGNSVAGFDIAGAEDGFPIRDHLEALTLLQREGVPFTVHAGEMDGEHSVWETVHVAHALRLGHGTRIIEDVTLNGRPLSVGTAVKDVTAAREAGVAELNLGKTAQWVVDRGIPLEQCVTSNSAAGVVLGIENHPIELLRSLGFTLTINPDNRLMSKTSISREFRRISDQFGWAVAEFAEAERAGVNAAFLSRADRQSLRDQLDASIAQFSA
jgi:adenosine deaminase